MNESLTIRLKQQAEEYGFVLHGVAAAAEPGRLDAFYDWLDSGMNAQMTYLETRREAYRHPNSIVDGCRSLLMLGLPYGSQERNDTSREENYQSTKGQVARYARSQHDYHDVIHGRLKKLKKWLEAEVPSAKVRGVVDTAPLLEREFAEVAGLGWVGKNTLLINRKWGSYFFLAALLTDVELQPDPAYLKNHCGNCTACLTSCPTGAFPEPYVLDANRCVSYQTIENREQIDEDLRGHLSEWIFGCDICQEVCPWNRKSQPGDPELDHVHSEFEISELLTLDEEEFRERFRKTPFWRPRRRGLLRNAILLAGNKRSHSSLPRLRNLLADEEPMLRMTAAWAIMQIRASDWEKDLRHALRREQDAEVRDKIEHYLASKQPNS